MRARWLLGVIAVTACGRVGFTGQSAADAGTDGGEGGIPIDATPSRCPGSSFLVCDGFDEPSFHPRWLPDFNNGVATTDSARVYRGGSSLRSHVDAVGATPVSSPRGIMRSYEGLPVIGTIFIRVFAFLPSTLPTRFVQLVNATDDDGLGASTGMENRSIVNNDYAVTPATFARSLVALLPLDRWFCLTYEVPSDVPGSLRVFVDDAEITDAAILPQAVHPGPTHVYLGIDFPEMVTNQPATDAWFDELAIDDAPIRCAD